MLPHLKDPEVISLLRQLHGRVPEHEGFCLTDRGFRKKLSCLSVGNAVPEDPRIPPRSPGDHYKITAGLIHHPLRLQRGIDIPVPDDRNTHSLLHTADHIPVRLPGIVLFSRSSMDRDHICPRVLEGFRDFDGIFLFLIESCPDLHRDRPVRDLFQFPDDRRRLRNVPHKCRSLMIVHDFRHRTSHIHIQKVERLFPETLKCIHKALRIRSEKLHRDRVLLTAYVDEFQCLFISVTDRIGADHLHGHE